MEGKDNQTVNNEASPSYIGQSGHDLLGGTAIRHGSNPPTPSIGRDAQREPMQSSN